MEPKEKKKKRKKGKNRSKYHVAVITAVMLVSVFNASCQSIDKQITEIALANVMATCMLAEDEGEDVTYVKSIINVAKKYMTVEAIEEIVADPELMKIHNKYKGVKIKEKTANQIFEKWKRRN